MVLGCGPDGGARSFRQRRLCGECPPHFVPGASTPASELSEPRRRATRKPETQGLQLIFGKKITEPVFVAFALSSTLYVAGIPTTSGDPIFFTFFFFYIGDPISFWKTFANGAPAEASLVRASHCALVLRPLTSFIFFSLDLSPPLPRHSSHPIHAPLPRRSSVAGGVPETSRHSIEGPPRVRIEGCCRHSRPPSPLCCENAVARPWRAAGGLGPAWRPAAPRRCCDASELDPGIKR